MQDAPYETPREVITAEYGDSRNLITPHVLTHLGTPNRWAAEVAHGEGIAPGSFVVGVSVVAVVPGGTERVYDLSTSFHGPDVNALVDEALDYCRDLDERVEEYLDQRRKLDVAERLGREAGEAAGSWVLDGNSTEETAQRLLDGIDQGDPEILDALPSAPLSGEWADGPTPDDVVREVEAEVEVSVSEEERDGILDAYERGFAVGVEAEVIRAARGVVS